MPSLSTLPKDLALFAKYHLRHPTERHPAREEELGLVELGFDLDGYLADLATFGDDFEVREEARLDYAGRVHRMVSLRSRAEAERTLFVMAGIHGNERAGLLAVPRILERFDASRGVRLVVLTPTNPVGVAALSRFNADGYDINRDFVRFETEEARVVRALYEREAPDFVISLHEGPQDATFVFANRHVESALVARGLAAMEAGGTELATRDYFGLRLDPPGLSASSAVSRAVHAAWAATLGMMATIRYSEERGIPELVLESSWRDPDAEARIRPHVDLVDAISAAL
ncbi:MAG TPA: hypothetical protein DEF51_50830 [Myxococcales bacterium]|nr:hypothetical protein [Myxococcales bacterium]